jgi:hypothetical protein
LALAYVLVKVLRRYQWQLEPVETA